MTTSINVSKDAAGNISAETAPVNTRVDQGASAEASFTVQTRIGGLRKSTGGSAIRAIFGDGEPQTSKSSAGITNATEMRADHIEAFPGSVLATARLGGKTVDPSTLRPEQARHLIVTLPNGYETDLATAMREGYIERDASGQYVDAVKYEAPALPEIDRGIRVSDPTREAIAELQSGMPVLKADNAVIDEILDFEMTADTRRHFEQAGRSPQQAQESVEIVSEMLLRDIAAETGMQPETVLNALRGLHREAAANLLRYALAGDLRNVAEHLSEAVLKHSALDMPSLAEQFGPENVRKDRDGNVMVRTVEMGFVRADVLQKAGLL